VVEIHDLASPAEVATVINAVHSFAARHDIPEAAAEEGSREAAAREQYQLRSKA
jgi:hypothetical protein